MPLAGAGGRRDDASRLERLARPLRGGGQLHGRAHVDEWRVGDGDEPTDRAIADGEELQRSLWRSAGEALAGAPTDSAPRLYVETLNEMIDMQTVRVAALNNRVPGSVLSLIHI